jgi:molybdopterin converting factor small subunit
MTINMPSNKDMVTVTIHLPTALRRFSDQQAAIEVSAATVAQALSQAAERFPRLRTQIFAGDQTLRRFINVYVNSRDIRHLEREQTRLSEADAITLLPAIAGG